MENKKYEQIENYFINELDKNELGYKIEKGKGSVILIAPHSVSQLREGKVKTGEYRTGLIVKEVKKFTDSHVMYKTKNLNDDANYDMECNFKNNLIKYIKENNIKLALDFHISSSKREYDIDVGTGHGVNILGRGDITSLMLLKLKEYDIRVDDTFPASYKGTVSSTVSRKIGIPSFQIELNWNIIDSYEKTDKIIKEFTEIIKSIGDIL